MKAFCQRCGLQVQVPDYHPVCTHCGFLDACKDELLGGARVDILSGEASQTGLGGIPEAARRNSWWAQAKALVIPREQYAGN